MKADEPCPLCVEHANQVGWHAIRGAAASVGIEHGMTTDQMVRIYMDGVHRNHG